MNQIYELFGALLLLFYLIVLPVLVLVLFRKVSKLSQRLEQSEVKLPRTPGVVESNKSVAAPTVVSTESPAAVAPMQTPPPLPVKVVTAAASSTPLASVKPATISDDPLPRILRDYGLLPPSDLKGEYALGAWWTVRVGGALALASVVFLGIWLNLHSVLPAWVRLAELVVLGSALLVTGLKLQSKREDLGRVIGAAGLGVFVFAAWGTYGLEKMRIVESAAEAGWIQFVVSLLIAGFALYRKDRLYAQLSLIFSTLSVYFSLPEPVRKSPEITPVALAASSIALMGSIFYSRGGWSSTGVLGLLGALVALLGVSDVNAGKYSLILPLAAGIVLAVQWLGERTVKADGGFKKESNRVAYFLGLVLAPCVFALLEARQSHGQPMEHYRTTVAVILGVLTSVLGLVEARRSWVSTQVLWAASLVFLASGAAWWADDRMVWLVWVLASGLAQIAAVRSQSKILRWAAEGLAVVSVISFVDYPPAKPWMSIGALVVFALAAVAREWREVSTHIILKIVSILSLAVAIDFVQSQLPFADTVWPWLGVLVVAVATRSLTLFIAIIPAFLVSHFEIVRPSFTWKQHCLAFVPTLKNDHTSHVLYAGWFALWSALIAAIDGLAAGRLSKQESDTNHWRTVGGFAFGVLALVMSISAVFYLFNYVTVLHEVKVFMDTYVVLWLGGALCLALGTWLLAKFERPSLMSLGLLFGFILGVLIFASDQSTAVKLKETSLWLAGLLLVAYLTHKITDTLVWASGWRSLFASYLLLCTFWAFRNLPGAGISLFWALAAAMIFMLGYWLRRKSYRIVALVFLSFATFRVLIIDVTDLLGRVLASGTVAVVFLAVAWLYGKVAKQDKPTE